MSWPWTISDAPRLCECGCGVQAPVATRHDPRRGYVKGQPMRFVAGHAARLKPVTRPGVYPSVVAIVDGQKRVRRAHRIRAERALGRPLPEGVEVHHADGTKRADAPLVICPDRAYHMLLHQRMRVVKAGGNPNTDRVCGRCRGVKPTTEFYPRADGNFGGFHSMCRECARTELRARKARRRHVALEYR
jgi:hypothetical protein